jgi:hypothetical protein
VLPLDPDHSHNAVMEQLALTGVGVPDISDNQHPANNRVSNKAYDTFDADAATDFERGEALIASVHESLRAN